MYFPTISKRTYLVVAMIGLALALLWLTYLVFNNFRQNNAVVATTALVAETEPLAEQSAYGLPVRLKIPSINVDAVIIYVGLTSDGAVDTPKDQADVAWFESSPRPGDIGSAVINGHYGIKSGQPSVFDRLYKLRPGDKIYIEDDQGQTITFVMSFSRRYDPEAEATDVFVSDDGQAHLNIITCEGVWDKATQSYSKRLVIFADKE